MSKAAMFYRLLVACTVSKIETVSLEEKGTMHIVFFFLLRFEFLFCFFFQPGGKNVQIPSGTNVKASVSVRQGHLTSPSSSALAVVLTQALLGLELFQPLRRLLTALFATTRRGQHARRPGEER